MTEQSTGEKDNTGIIEKIPFNSNKIRLFEHIREKLPTFTRAFKQLAQYVLANPYLISSLSIEELAKAAGVSNATVNRFAHECNFDGYPQFKYAVREIYLNVIDKTDVLKYQIAGLSSDRQIAHHSLEEAIECIEYCQQGITEENLQRAADLILSAKNIYIMGYGMSAVHATFFQQCLEGYLFGKVFSQGLFGGTEIFSKHISLLPDDALVIAFSLPRYSSNILNVLNQVRKRNMKILLITDTVIAPAVPLADVSLFVSVSHSVLRASSTAVVALIEAICAAVIPKIEGAAEMMEKQMNAVLPYLYVDS